ncbi:MAG: NAD(P)/FAD-dependent oxidoreductase, partial [Candidatus Aminicenantes bacterium]|nr:NAD(P)/FAD-dependent oxidoreductase [Candidatus Aminicenantes bacterium]
RPGGFVFDVSLHSTTVDTRNGVANLIPGFPEIEEVEFVPHPNLYRLVLPEHDITVPQRNVPEYKAALTRLFPAEKEGIEGLFADMEGLGRDLSAYSSRQGEMDMRTFPKEFPNLFKCVSHTWDGFMDGRISDTKLRAIVSSQWGYYGLPPSKLASIYYALPFWSYLSSGGYYPIGQSQKISDAFVRFIEGREGKVKLRTRVEKILTKDHAAVGVRTTDGEEFTSRVIVANANAWDVFHGMLDMSEVEYVRAYTERLEKFSISISSFLVFLGLKKDLVGASGIGDTEIFWNTGYDPEAEYLSSLEADVEKSSLGITLYDNIYKGYSPAGKNTLSLLALQGYDHWSPYAADYRAGKKETYRKEKERMADILIDRVEKRFLPGLREAIEVCEVATPLTNVRYTSNYRGAIYGWNQTLDNSNPRRLPHKTPIANLYLSGAWTSPGHGYGAVIPSGLEAFGAVMEDWGKEQK